MPHPSADPASTSLARQDVTRYLDPPRRLGIQGIPTPPDGIGIPPPARTAPHSRYREPTRWSLDTSTRRVARVE
ncbi:hypothetical protein BN12_1610009 [Nostocoides japonicum T1-X7]|uniref:Uncharacterized protein n=1 Tax=Nostocoides japonicum T1-X7 TaxID=1194083 RepID=A0A077LUA2_9MICO|nr:hypothetical protein BN12_1610009 [Tetrasphaera japonica T1-X7]